MGAITITRFGGAVPRTAARLLPDHAAQEAANCLMTSGELRPLNQPAVEANLATLGPLLSLYRIVESGAAAWLSWAVDVDVAQVARMGGEARWCYTGDGEPRITNYALATDGGGRDYPALFRTLGVPAPVTAPTVAPSGGTGTAVERAYCYTFYSDWDEEGGVSPVSALTPGKVDDTWAISGMDAAPPNSGTVAGVFAAGETTFTDTLKTWLRVGERVTVGGDVLIVTAVPSSLSFKVAGDYSAAVAWARTAPWNTMSKRLYRTTGTAGTMELVAEGITATTYNDTLTDANIPGDELISADWDLPPVDLTGLCALASGAMAGFSPSERCICFSEPYQPHAWPTRYRMAPKSAAVALAPLSNGVAVATTANPYLITGTTPGQMSGEDWEESFPCESKRSMVSLGNTAVYAATMGLIEIGTAVNVFSLPWFTEVEWAALTPSSMVSAIAQRRLYVAHEVDGVARMAIFALTGDTSELTTAHVDADEIYADHWTGRLYLTVGQSVYEFAPLTGVPMSQDWWSKEFVTPQPINLGAARVRFALAVDPAWAAAVEAERAVIISANAALIAGGDVVGAFGTFAFGELPWAGANLQEAPEAPAANEVTFSLYTDGALRFTRTVSNPTAIFKLPAGYRSDHTAVRVQSQCLIESIEVGETPKSLAAT